jgi:hypothetical protein
MVLLSCRLITLLHGLHRSMYMGERMAYYDRRAEVRETFPVTDGMVMLVSYRLWQIPTTWYQ